MEDVAPALIEDVIDEFHRLYDKSDKIRALLGKVKEGTATFTEAQQYSLEVSRLIGAAYEKHISSAVLPDGRMHYNIASRLIPDTLDENYKAVSDYAVEVLKKLNENARIGLKAKAAEKDADRIEGLVNLASSAEQYDDVSKKLLTAFENFSQSIVDKTIQTNADLHYRAGLTPKIIRKSERKCCEWCANLAGEYDYPTDMPDDVFRRHENCRCTMEYDPGSGKRQNVHTKGWTTSADDAKIESRKILGLRVKQTAVRELSVHAVDQMANRNVTVEAIQDAILNPLDIKPVKYDDQGRPSFTVIGKKATIAINPETGTITTTYPTHSKTAKKLMKGE